LVPLSQTGGHVKKLSTGFGKYPEHVAFRPCPFAAEPYAHSTAKVSGSARWRRRDALATAHSPDAVALLEKVCVARLRRGFQRDV
jgi:hypothetical protein